LTIEILFFDLNKDASEVANIAFQALGMPFNLEGSSLNSLNGEYSSLSVFGLSIKLEANTYDYEDDYRYMISIYKDKLTELVVDDGVVLPVTAVIARLLADNIGINVAHEVNDKLDVYHPRN